MNFLIIYAHPKAEGFSSYVLESVRNTLAKSNINFEVIDLYKIGYDPILKL